MMGGYRTRAYEQYVSGFLRTGEEFDAAAADRWGKAYDWYLHRWMPPQKDAAILDLGCGNGKLLRFFSIRGYTNLTGVDICAEQLTLARQVTPSVFEQNVLEFLPSHRRQFDLIISLDMIEHMQKDEALQLVDLCHQALKPGGRLVLQCPNADTPLGTSLRYADLTHEVSFQVKSMTQLLRLAGFEEIDAVEQGPVPRGYSITSTLRWLAWRAIRTGIKAYNLVETGAPGTGIFSRVFIVSARDA